MELIDLLGYCAALLIGLILGLIGGGGSILAVPVLAYLFLLDEKLATGYSLFIVGCSAFVGGVKQVQKGNVDFKTALIFGIPAILSVIFVRSTLIPIIPDEIFSIYGFSITRRMGMFGLFALIMIPAALAMLNPLSTSLNTNKTEQLNYNYIFMPLQGAVIGMLTGIVGAGGGFLIIPTLVIITRIDIKTAIGTSLVIVTLQSLIGFFLGDAQSMAIDWGFLLLFTSIAVVGIFIGSYLNHKINEQKLRKGFGYFILLMAVLIFYMEFL
ncbi:sulfite exporter TauE/SafE family protein [Flavobacteriaceae bacterium]|jgi:uncharacterized membrane protein YfcA|nr:sulfite exporter TauE/SafE family protein [Flavobacteriaceae bacterium]